MPYPARRTVRRFTDQAMAARIRDSKPDSHAFEIEPGLLDPRRVVGYEHELRGQLDAGRAIAQGFADTAIGTASSARLFALDFVPLSEERCTLFVPRRSATTPEVRALLDALRSTAYRRDLEALDAYDATRTGELIA